MNTDIGKQTVDCFVMYRQYPSGGAKYCTYLVLRFWLILLPRSSDFVLICTACCSAREHRNAEIAFSLKCCISARRRCLMVAVLLCIEQVLIRKSRFCTLILAASRIATADNPITAQNRLWRLQGTKVCRYNWHSAGSLRYPFPVLKYKYIFQINIRKQFYQTALGNCYGLKLELPKC